VEIDWKTASKNEMLICEIEELEGLNSEVYSASRNYYAFLEAFSLIKTRSLIAREMLLKYLRKDPQTN